jgi:hypothetical protein
LGILEWHNRFKVGRESVEDTLRGLGTSEKRSEENGEKLWRFCCTDKQFSVRGMDHVSNLEKGMARKILKVICA